MTVRIKKIAGRSVDPKAMAAKLASNATAVTVMASLVASSKKITGFPSATAKSVGKATGSRTRFKKVNGPQSVFTCADASDCGFVANSTSNAPSRGICNLNGFHSAFIKSCVCSHNATGTFLGFGCKDFKRFLNRPHTPAFKTAKSADNELAFGVSGISYTAKSSFYIANISNATYQVTFLAGTTFPSKADLALTLIERQPIPNYQVEQGVKSLGGDHIKLLPAGFSFTSGAIRISMKINSPCTPDAGTKHVVMKLLNTGGWQAQPTTSNIHVDYSTCVLTFSTSSFSVYGAFNIPLPSGSSPRLSVGAIIGIAIGSVVFVALVCYGAYRRKQSHEVASNLAQSVEDARKYVESADDAQAVNDCAKIQTNAPDTVSSAHTTTEGRDVISASAAASAAKARSVKRTAPAARPSPVRPKPKLTATSTSHWAFAFVDGASTATAVQTSPVERAKDIQVPVHSNGVHRSLSAEADGTSLSSHLNDVRVDLDRVYASEQAPAHAAGHNELNVAPPSAAATAGRGRVVRPVGARAGDGRPFVRQQVSRPAADVVPSEYETAFEVEPKWLGDIAL